MVLVVSDFNALARFSCVQVTVVGQANPQGMVNKSEEYCKLYENELQGRNVLIRRIVMEQVIKFSII